MGQKHVNINTRAAGFTGQGGEQRAAKEREGRETDWAESWEDRPQHL